MHWNSDDRIFAPRDFINGEVRFDSFDIDPNKPLAPQFDGITRDLMVVRFHNGCLLDIEWRAASDTSGRFIVSLVQVPPDASWHPFLQRECHSVLELQR